MADWNKRYTEAPARLFGSAPNEYVREVMARSDVSPRSALCLADGDGRNGAWLAAQGLNVTALDISDVATAQATKHDDALGVKVARHTADLATWSPDAGQTWDAAFMIYLQCETEVRNRAAARAAAALNPGGWFVAEGFADDDPGLGKLGPGKPDLLYARDDLIAALDGLEIIEAFTGITRLNEGEKHQGPGWVLRILARKP